MAFNTPAADACVLLFVKSPAHVPVKSRLAEAVDEEMARELYRNFVLDIMETLSGITAKSGAATTVCVYPPEAEREMQTWLGGDRRYLPQEGNNLGERMRNAFLRSFSDGYRRAILIGSDAPDLTGEIITEGLACLEDRDAVIGPAHDGGYYLIGFRSGSFLPAVFDDIPWGTVEVFARTMQIFRRFAYDVPVLPPWRDIDTYDDLRHLKISHQQGPFADSRTMRYLRLHGM